MKSLGLFAIALFLIAIGVLIYIILKRCKGAFCLKIRTKLRDKLFYNAFLRYMTVSNLKLNFTLWGFMSLYYTEGSYLTFVFGPLLLLLMLYPVLLMIGLLRNHHRVEEEKFHR